MKKRTFKQYTIKFIKPITQHIPADLSPLGIEQTYTNIEHISTSWRYTLQDFLSHKGNVKEVVLETKQYTGRKLTERTEEKINPDTYNGIDLFAYNCAHYYSV